MTPEEKAPVDKGAFWPRNWDQSVPTPPPPLLIKAFSAKVSKILPSESSTVLRKQEIGRARLVPMFVRTGVAGIHQPFAIIS